MTLRNNSKFKQFLAIFPRSVSSIVIWLELIATIILLHFPAKKKCNAYIMHLKLLVDDFCVGMGYGWSAPVLKYLTSVDDHNDGLHLTMEQASWVIAIAELGKFTSPLAGGLVDRYGRRAVLTGCAVVYLISWTGIAVSKSLIILYVCRYLFGLALGLNDVASCIYIGEITHPKIRGAFLSGLTTLFFAGILTGFVLGNYLTYAALAYSIVTTAALFLILCPLLLVETPQYLLTRDKFERAKKTLIDLRSDALPSEVELELSDIKDHLVKERTRHGGDKSDKSFLRSIKDRTNMKIFLLIGSLCAIGPMSGYNAIVYYASVIFGQGEGVGMMTANQFTILYGVIQLCASFVTTCVIETNGRRFLLLTFASLSCVIHLTTAVLFYVRDEWNTINNNTNSTHALNPDVANFSFYTSWAIFVTVTIYSALFTFGFLPTNFTLRSELFPQDLKSYGGSLAVLCHAGSSFVCSKMFATVSERIGTYANFVVFSIASLLTFLITYLWIPETKGKTLVEIQKHFRNER